MAQARRARWQAAGACATPPSRSSPRSVAPCCSSFWPRRSCNWWQAAARAASRVHPRRPVATRPTPVAKGADPADGHAHAHAHTRTRTGLLVKAALDTRHYDTAVQVSDAAFATVRLTPHAFHGDWNYTIHPRLGVIQ